MYSSIGFGFYLVVASENKKTPRLVKRVAKSAWGLFEMSWADLLVVQAAAADGGSFPKIESLKCLNVGGSRYRTGT